MSYQLSVHAYPMDFSVPLSEHINFYGMDTFMPIIGTYMLRADQWDFPGITKTHFVETINITNNRTEYWDG